jgi:hypothetical protein
MFVVFYKFYILIIEDNTRLLYLNTFLWHYTIVQQSIIHVSNKKDPNEEEKIVLHIGRSYICSILSSVAIFTKIREHSLNFFTYDYRQYKLLYLNTFLWHYTIVRSMDYFSDLNKKNYKVFWKILVQLKLKAGTVVG